MNRYIHTLAIMLAVWLTAGNAMAQEQESGEQQGQGSGSSSTGVVVRGNVYGGGNQADVQTNTTVNISTGQVEGNVYGGGNLGDVGKIDKTNIRNYRWTVDNSGNTTEIYNNTGVCTVTITGGTIGPEGTPDEHHGNVFGAGKGDDDTFWCEKGMVYKTVVSISNSTVKRNVYGGGEVGRVDNNTTVTIGPASGESNTDIKGSVFGAGAGVNTHGYSALVRGNTYVTVQGDAEVEENVYGGGQIAAVGKYNLVTKANQSEHPELEVGMPYSLVDENLGICNVTIQGGAVIAGNVFGAGQGVIPKDDYEYTVTEDNGKYVYDMPCRMMSYDSDVYKYANLHKTWEYAEDYPLGYEGSKYVWEYFDTEAKYLTFIETLALATQTVVIIGEDDEETKIQGSVYGGSENGFVQHHVAVTIQGDCEIGTNAGGGYVYGGGRGLEGYPTLGRVSGNTTVAINGGTMHSSVYGGGQMGIVKGGVSVCMTGGTVNLDVYGGGALADTNTGNWNEYVLVNGLTAGSSLETGLYEKSGRGYALTEDETAVEGKAYYNKVSTWADATEKSALNVTTVNLLGGTIVGDAYGGGLGRFESGTVGDSNYKSLVEAKVYGETKVNLNGMTVGERNAAPASIQGLFASSAIDGNGDSDLTDNDDDYYTVSSKGCIVNQVFGCNNQKGSPQGNVTVHVFATQNKNVSKTVIGAHYVSDKEIEETLKSTTVTVSQLKAILADQIVVAKKISVATTTPYDYEALYANGEATVALLKEKIPLLTKAINDAADTDAEKAAVNALRYDLKAVYGGGNESAYVPMYDEDTGDTDFKTQVIIEGCEYTSIETVYGGGNAASVPETNVAIKAAYEIGTVFGGGNGNEPTEHFNPNPGADIGTYKNASDIDVRYGSGNANTLITGGYIHEAYGGSNERGTIMGTVNLTSNAGTVCDMLVKKMVTAGKNADIMGDAITILGCMPDSWVDEFYAGADNANVHGKVELTITSGKFHKVFGGNNKSGIIMGHIKVNIEETGCQPIIIDELYLGGNDAAYSTYGYYVIKDNSNAPILTDNGKLKFKPRESETDSHLAVTSFTGTTYAEQSKVEGETYSFKYDDHPELNIISCTHIGQVFGGGYGTGAIMYGDPTVNINMIAGSFANDNTKGVPSIMDELELDKSKENSSRLGVIGDVYGGGNAADVIGKTTVNIGTVPTVQYHESVNASGVYTMGTARQVQGAYIAGSVYGGGKGSADTFTCEKAMVGKVDDGVDHPGDGTIVNIYKGFVRGNVYGGGEVGRVEKNTAVTIGHGDGEAPTDPPSYDPVIKGSVFGGGAGVKTHGYSALVRGNPTVIVQGNAKVEKSVYGGGEIASVARYSVVNGAPVALAEDANGNVTGNCTVTIQGYAEIGPDGMKMYHADDQGNIAATDKPDDYGHVFGAGKGVLPEVYDRVTEDDYEGEGEYKKEDHFPRRMMAYSPYVVTEDGPTGRHKSEDENVTWEYSDSEHKNVWEYFITETDYFDFLETLALATQTNLTIGGHAFVKGSAYGGSENGTVQYNTNVTIQENCQIGQGKEIATRYEDYTGGSLFSSTTPPIKSGTGSTAVYYDLECASWDYGKVEGSKTIYAPYDPNANAAAPLDKYPAVGTAAAKSTEGGRRIASDGHTYYGNVFGGGSGSVPYFDTQKGVSRYIMTAGQVKGNANVTISGGHILTNVYGGCETTNVLGKATITMSAGTIGVPRTRAQIEAHPVTCYLFGAGKGDQRVFFNKDTNVEDVEVEVTGGTIFGSVYGGGEDGHVLRDVTMTIGTQTTTEGVTTTSGPTIGNWGTSYFDGNVFGGGRGFGGDAYTAGNVAGSIEMKIKGGTMLGSVYGGGRLGSVGYGLFDAVTNNQPTPGYGEMREDETSDDGFNTTFENGRGHIDIEISGGTIGNDDEYKYISFEIDTENLSDQEIEEAKTNGLNDQKADIPNTEFELYDSFKTDEEDEDDYKYTYIYRLKHTKGGNVFAGGMGRRTQLDGITPISSIDWKKLGCVKQTKLTIKGSAEIKSNVYGGGELGAVIPYTSGSTVQGGTTEIDIQGGTIGTDVKTGTGGSAVVRYTFGSVYGGGMGSEDDTSAEDNIGGRVEGSTKIDMSGGTVKASVYGGGELAVVKGSHTVTDSSGDPILDSEDNEIVVGTEINISGTAVVGYNLDGFGGATMGNVYGGGKGSLATPMAGLIKNNTRVNISAGTIYHNIYGGGAYGSVGTFTFTTGIPTWGTANGTGKTEVIIGGGTIGINGHENGMVFGSSRGDVAAPTGSPAVDPNDCLAWVYNTHVVIGGSSGGPNVKGAVYGSGENGHTYNNTLVDVNQGVIGITSGYPIGTYTEGGATYPYRGNVYGGGCGTDTYKYTYSEKYDSDDDGDIDDDDEEREVEAEAFNPLAGIVLGDTEVNINGGTVVRNVYGAGAMGSVGRTTRTTTTTTNNGVETTTKTATTTGGLTTINVSGGTIGVSGTVGDGNVFGAARGSKDVVQADRDDLARVRETNVNVSAGEVKGNVYGGGELGDVGTIFKNTTNYNYAWEKIGGGANGDGNNDIASADNTNTGICNVTITGGTIGSTTAGTGNVFGGGKGDANTWWCEKAMAFATNVSISETSSANTVVYGSVYGGGEIGRVEDDTKVIIGSANGSDTPEIKGSVFGAGKGLATRGYSALVRGNSIVTVQGSAQIGRNVFGGGEEASLGRFNLVGGLPKSPQSGGYSTVTIQDNAKIGSSGTSNHVYGAGQGVTPNYDAVHYQNFKSMQLYGNRPKGDKDVVDTYWNYYVDDDGNEDRNFVWVYYTTEEEYLAFLNTLALASYPTVTIAENATVYGDVYGGGMRGVTLGDVTVNITGGTVKRDVYGGGSLADTNKGNWDADRYVAATVAAGASVAGLYTTTGNDANGNPIYTPTAANATADGSTTYYLKGSWAADKYNTTTHATTFKTNVNLTGGIIENNVYGGGLGQLAKAAVAAQTAVPYADFNEYNTDKGTSLTAEEFGALSEAEKIKTPAVEAQDAMSAVEAKVYGDVLVTLNGIKSTETTGEGENATTTNTYYDCEVQDKIFGCNNLNGSPQSAVTVHVYNTVKKDGSGNVTAKPTKESGTYEVEAVYGGGNLAAYKPDLEATADTAKAYVIIDGCDLTSIKQVYGGGNAASTPATNVTVNGTYEIREVFGGGNGADPYTIDGKTYENPGANVGYDSYAYHTWNASQDKYLVSEYGPGDGDDKDASTKDKRLDNYKYGSGETHVSIYGGTVHAVYGGSNSKGNVRVASVALLDDEKLQTCDFNVDEAYGGGKNADMDGTATLIMSCIQGMKEVYGGAENADVLNNVTLNITNGTFDQVFGGNNVGGRITGSITVNIEETGCKPVIIGELYGGGNMAGYSIYGYKEVNGKWVPRTSNTDEGTGPASPYSDPQINVKSFTGIGNIFGGGFGETAVMVASPTVNIDVVKGRFSNQTSHERFTNKQWTLDSANKRYSKTIGGATVYVPAHEVNTIGGIYNVFGGGNAAKVIGTPHVKVGTQDYVEITTNLSDVRGYCTRTGGAGTQANPYTYSEPITGENALTPTANTSYYKKVEGVDIRGNIYGGGNKAEVQGDTDVVIGKAAPTTP